MPAAIPNIPPLFKYCDTNAVPILQNCQLKVPTSFNDPFELSPVVRCSDPHAFAVRYARSVLTDPSFYNAHRSSFPSCQDFNAFRAFARANLHVLYGALVSSAVLTPINLRRTLESMLAGFDAAFAKGKELVADFLANEKFNLSRTSQYGNVNEIIGKFVGAVFANFQRATAFATVLFCKNICRKASKPKLN